MTVREWIDEKFDEVIVADGFDDALIGVAHHDTAVYDADMCIVIIMRDSLMSEQEAIEYFEYNVTGACIEGGPLFVFRPSA